MSIHCKSCTCDNGGRKYLYRVMRQAAQENHLVPEPVERMLETDSPEVAFRLRENLLKEGFCAAWVTCGEAA